MNSLLNQLQLKELLSYDPDIGVFTWKIKSGRCSAGSVAGGVDYSGYVDIRLRGKKYRAHRLAWLYMTGAFPNNIVDHIDRCKCNNKWHNLRDVTHSQNNMNRVGISNIYKPKRPGGKYQVVIQKKHIAMCENLELAQLVVLEAREKINRGFILQA